MITNASPIDYKKRIVIVSALVRICADCGGNTCISPRTGERVCVDCHGTRTVEAWEHELDALRAEIREARQIADALAPAFDALRHGLTTISYLNGDEPTERW